jgi:hypothetical protein
VTFLEKPSAFLGPFGQRMVRMAPSTRSTPIPGVPGPVENEIPISQLPLAGVLFGDEQVAVVQNGITCRALAGSLGSTSVYSAIRNELLPITTQNSIPSLALPPDGQMVLLFVNGRVFAAVSGAFSVTSNTITWLSHLFSVNPGDEVVACYSYSAFGAPEGMMQEDILSITTVIEAGNVLPLLSQTPNFHSFTLFVEGRPFFLGVANPAFAVSGKLITWISTVYSVVPGNEVVAQYTF